MYLDTRDWRRTIGKRGRTSPSVPCDLGSRTPENNNHVKRSDDRSIDSISFTILVILVGENQKRRRAFHPPLPSSIRVVLKVIDVVWVGH